MLSRLYPLADPGASRALLNSRASEIRDWEGAAASAAAHGLLPLLDRWFSSERVAGVPPELATYVRLTSRSSALSSLRLTGELISLTRILEAAGVPVLALKGPALAVRAYGDVALRPQNDIDLLIHRRDIDRALSALAPASYAPVKALGAGQEAAYREVEYHHALAGASGLSVELHWGIIKRQFGLKVAEDFWWTDPHLVSLGGTQVRALSNEATLVYLAIHGTKHEWHHLRWIGDIAGVARLTPMDWERVRRMSAKLGTLRQTRLALALAMDLLEAELPEPAVRLARGDRAVPGLVAEVRKRVAANDEPAGFVASTAFQLAVRDRWRDKISFASYHAVMPGIDDITTASLPRAWRWLYVALRPVRLVQKWVGLLLANG